jgi:catechol 2,3-dioxygenase-like lactoylglutathione lyase family enzyme
VARGFARLSILPALSLAAAAAAADERPLPDVVSVLSRTAIVVHDLEASKRFYTYALGYKVGFDGDITRPIIATQLGLAEGQRAWFTVLESTNVVAGQKRDGAMIGLLSITNPEPPRMARPAGHDLAIGEAMLAVRTTDIATTHARLKELGARILLEPLPSPDGTQVELVVHDPDGIRIHVVERSDPAP